MRSRSHPRDVVQHRVLPPPAPPRLGGIHRCSPRLAPSFAAAPLVVVRRRDVVRRPARQVEVKVGISTPRVTCLT